MLDSEASILKEGSPSLAGRGKACLVVHCTQGQQKASEGQPLLLWRIAEGRPYCRGMATPRSRLHDMQPSLLWCCTCKQLINGRW